LPFLVSIPFAFYAGTLNFDESTLAIVFVVALLASSTVLFTSSYTIKKREQQTKSRDISPRKLTIIGTPIGAVIGSIAGLVGVGWLVRLVRTKPGKLAMSHFILKVPVVGKLFRKLYLSRIADNLYTLLSSGISIVRALEITGTVVGNAVYEDILMKAKEKVSDGIPLSDVFAEYEEIPLVMVQIIKVGEETGELGNILKTLSSFYKREVDNAVDTLIDLIEPILIVALGLGVGLILTSVLVPIYNVSTGI